MIAVVTAIGWTVLAVVVALGVGRAIRIADQRSTCCPLHPAGDDS